MASTTLAYASSPEKLIEFSRDPVLTPELLGNLAITSCNCCTCSFTPGKMSRSFSFCGAEATRKALFFH